MGEVATKAKRVSVVVPAFNEALLLPHCLQSLRAQDYSGPIEILVVDNASTDGTADVARAHGATVVHEPVQGYSRALTTGFDAATGDIIACTDADSVVPRDWVSRLVGEYERDEGIVAVGGEIQFERPNWKSVFLTRVLIPLVNKIDRGSQAGPHMWGANMSVRRDAFEAVGGWNPKFSLQADSELSERLRQVGRVTVLESLAVQTSSRRWNRSIFSGVYLYVANWIWFHIFGVPLYLEFPAIRDDAGPKPARRRHLRLAIGLSVAVMLIGAVGYGAFEPQSSAFGRTYWTCATDRKVVALTFDDGPNEPYTSRVLDILRREHVRATFFLIGSNVRRSPASVAAIRRDGHAIGNHSDTHPVCFALKPESQLQAEIDSAERSIHEAGGGYPGIFRPPQGLRSPWLMSVLERDSLTAVTWDDAPRDWDPIPAPELVKRTLAAAHPGAIILLHDGMNLTFRADQSETVKALPQIIDGLRARGYSFCTVPEMIGVPATLADWVHGPPANTAAITARESAR